MLLMYICLRLLLLENQSLPAHLRQDALEIQDKLGWDDAGAQGRDLYCLFFCCNIAGTHFTLLKKFYRNHAETDAMIILSAAYKRCFFLPLIKYLLETIHAAFFI